MFYSSLFFLQVSNTFVAVHCARDLDYFVDFFFISFSFSPANALTTTSTSACDSKIINDLHSNELNKRKKKHRKSFWYRNWYIYKLWLQRIDFDLWFESVAIDERIFWFDPLFWNIVTLNESNEKHEFQSIAFKVIQFARAKINRCINRLLSNMKLPQKSQTFVRHTSNKDERFSILKEISTVALVGTQLFGTNKLKK